MDRTLAYILGPELIWTLAFVVASILAARNHPPTEAMSKQLEIIGWILPAVVALLSFAPLAWTPGGKWWLLLRILIVGIIAAGVVSWKICSGIDYQDSRNSGLFAAWAMFFGSALVVLVIGEVIVAFFLLTKWRVWPFAKWTLIIFTVLATL